MKKSMWVAGLLSFVVALTLAAPAIAQQTHYIIQVPFSFAVNAHVLPAGEYRIAIVSPHTVQIQGVKGTAIATFFGSGLNNPFRLAQNQIVFRHYGRQYFLSQVWFAEVDAGYELRPSNAEREYAKQNPGTESVLLAGK